MYALIAFSLISMVCGHFGAGYIISLLIGIGGIVAFAKLNMGTGLQILVTSMLAVFIWAVALVGVSSDKKDEKTAKKGKAESSLQAKKKKKQ